MKKYSYCSSGFGMLPLLIVAAIVMAVIMINIRIKRSVENSHAENATRRITNLSSDSSKEMILDIQKEVAERRLSTRMKLAEKKASSETLKKRGVWNNKTSYEPSIKGKLLLQ